MHYPPGKKIGSVYGVCTLLDLLLPYSYAMLLYQQEEHTITPHQHREADPSYYFKQILVISIHQVSAVRNNVKFFCGHSFKLKSTILFLYPHRYVRTVYSVQYIFFRGQNSYQCYVVVFTLQRDWRARKNTTGITQVQTCLE